MKFNLKSGCIIFLPKQFVKLVTMEMNATSHAMDVPPLFFVQEMKVNVYTTATATEMIVI